MRKCVRRCPVERMRGGGGATHNQHTRREPDDAPENGTLGPGPIDLDTVHNSWSLQPRGHSGNGIYMTLAWAIPSDLASVLSLAKAVAPELPSGSR